MRILKITVLSVILDIFLSGCAAPRHTSVSHTAGVYDGEPHYSGSVTYSSSGYYGYHRPRYVDPPLNHLQ